MSSLSSDSSSDEDREIREKMKKEAQKKAKKEDRKRLAKPKETETKKAKISKEVDETDDGMIDLGKMKFVNVRDFKGNVYVDIREYYFDKQQDKKPGKKGISLNMEQWNKFKSAIDQIDEKVREF